MKSFFVSTNQNFCHVFHKTHTSLRILVFFHYKTSRYTWDNLRQKLKSLCLTVILRNPIVSRSLAPCGKGRWPNSDVYFSKLPISCKVSIDFCKHNMESNHEAFFADSWPSFTCARTLLCFFPLTWLSQLLWAPHRTSHTWRHETKLPT